MKRSLLLTCALMLGNIAHAQEGVPDTSFGTLGSGRVVFGFDLPANGFDSPAGIVTDIQGRTYAVGLSADLNNTVWRATLARLTANGALDNTFGIGGKVVSTALEGSFLAQDLARDSLGQLLVAGSRVFGDITQGDRDFLVCRFSLAGAAIDFAAPTSNHCRSVPFDLGGNNQDQASIIKTLPNGSMYLVGYAVDSANFATAKIAVVKLTSTGALDTTFSGDGKLAINYPGGNATYIYDADVGADGALYLSGEVDISGSLAVLAVKIGATGVLDTAFGGDGFQAYQLDLGAPGFRDDIGRAIALRNDGKLVIGGSAQTALDQVNGFVLRISSTNAGFDPSFGNAGRLILGSNVAITDVLALADGKTVYAAALKSAGTTRFRIGRLGEGGHDLKFGLGGVSDISFGLAQGLDFPRELALSGERVVAMGVVYNSLSDSEFGIARLTGDAMFANGFE